LTFHLADHIPVASFETLAATKLSICQNA
jgi:hypothetical protein